MIASQANAWESLSRRQVDFNTVKNEDRCPRHSRRQIGEHLRTVFDSVEPAQDM